MADGNRTPSDALELFAALEAAPYEFDLFEALRFIEAKHRSLPRLGEGARAADEPVRLRQVPEMIFAPATIAAFSGPKDGKPASLSTYFYGVFGPNGPMPLHLTEYARDRVRNAGDRTMVAFMDMFHHRMMALFYRAWAASQPTVAFDRPETDRFATYVAAMIGLGMPTLRNRDAMPDVAKLHFAGRFSHLPRNAEGLRAIISEYFQVPVEIEQFIGDWVDLPHHSLCELGRTPDTGTLGSTASIGERIHVFHQKFRIFIGPLELDDYERLLPGEASLDRLVAIVRNYVGDQFAWDVNMILAKQEVPDLRLGQGLKLGWTTWLGTRKSEKDTNDLYLNPLFRAA